MKICFMMRFDSATSSFLALLANKSQRKKKLKKQNSKETFRISLWKKVQNHFFVSGVLSISPSKRLNKVALASNDR